MPNIRVSLAEPSRVELNQLIAAGRTAEIYAWEDDQVLKLFYPWYDPQSAEHEAAAARAVWDLGLPVPQVGALLKVEGRIGLVYARMDGEPMTDLLGRKPWELLSCARSMAELHSELHACRLQACMHARSIRAALPPQREQLREDILQACSLPEALRGKALRALAALPDGDRLCHGDFHPGNILLIARGAEAPRAASQSATARSTAIIDWADAACGNPLADLARTSILVLGAAACQTRSSVQRVLTRLFHRIYLRNYFSLCPAGEREYQAWLPVSAASRLREDIPELEEWLLRQVEAGLECR